jgi:hypothetical protein
VDQELVQYLDRRFNELRDELRQEFRTGIAASTAETRRHFDVVAEQMMGKLQLVAEGVSGVGENVDRLATEMRTEFRKVDRRFLNLEARIIPRRD